MDTWKQIGVGASHGGVMGLHMRCTKSHQNTPKCTISHSGQTRDTLFCHAMVTILVHFDAFWCILVHLMCNPLTPPWLALTPLPLQVSIHSRNGSYQSLRTNSNHSALTCYVQHFSAFWCFWCILVHLMCNPMTPPWLALTPITFGVSIYSRNGLH